MTDVVARCAHPACECTVAKGGPYGKYCSDHCKEASQFSELRCGCQHQQCREGGQPAGVDSPGAN
jgi:hypothetical protein